MEEGGAHLTPYMEGQTQANSLKEQHQRPDFVEASLHVSLSEAHRGESDGLLVHCSILGLGTLVGPLLGQWGRTQLRGLVNRPEEMAKGDATQEGGEEEMLEDDEAILDTPRGGGSE